MCVQTTIDMKGRLLKAKLFCSLRHEKPWMNGKQEGFSSVFANRQLHVSAGIP
jgi:hypothetical protein